MEGEVVVIGPKKTKKKTKIYKCSECNYQTNRTYNVQRHLAKHEKPPKELQHLCPFAGCSFSSLRWDNLNRHIQRLHTTAENARENSRKSKQTDESLEAAPCEEDSILMQSEEDLPLIQSDEDIESLPEEEYLEYPDSEPDDEHLVALAEEDYLASIPCDEIQEPEPQTKPTQKTAMPMSKKTTGKAKRSYQRGETKCYECNTCNYRTNRCYNIKRHIVKHMENLTNGILLHVCIISGCSFVTPRWDNLCRHVKRVHPDAEKSSPN